MFLLHFSPSPFSFSSSFFSPPNMIFPPAFAKSNWPGCSTPFVAGFAKEKPVDGALPLLLPLPPKENDVLGVVDEPNAVLPAPNENGFDAPVPAAPLLLLLPKPKPVLDVNAGAGAGEAEDLSPSLPASCVVLLAEPNVKPVLEVKGLVPDDAAGAAKEKGDEEVDFDDAAGAANGLDALAVSSFLSLGFAAAAVALPSLAADAAALPSLAADAAGKSTFLPPKANPPLGKSNLGRSFGFSAADPDSPSAGGALKALPPKEKPPAGAGANFGGPDAAVEAGAVDDDVDGAAASGAGFDGAGAGAATGLKTKLPVEDEGAGAGAAADVDATGLAADVDASGFAAEATPLVPTAPAFLPGGAGAIVGTGRPPLPLPLPLAPDFPSLSLTNCDLFALYLARTISTTGARSSNSWSTFLPSKGIASSSVDLSEWLSPRRLRR